MFSFEEVEEKLLLVMSKVLEWLDSSFKKVCANKLLYNIFCPFKFIDRI